MRAIACYSATACFPIIVRKYPCNTPKCLQSAKTAGKKTFRAHISSHMFIKKKQDFILKTSSAVIKLSLCSLCFVPAPWFRH